MLRRCVREHSNHATKSILSRSEMVSMYLWWAIVISVQPNTVNTWDCGSAARAVRFGWEKPGYWWYMWWICYRRVRVVYLCGYGCTIWGRLLKSNLNGCWWTYRGLIGYADELCGFICWLFGLNFCYGWVGRRVFANGGFELVVLLLGMNEVNLGMRLLCRLRVPLWMTNWNIIQAQL